MVNQSATEPPDSDVGKLPNASDDALAEARISFAREVFSNVQDLTKTLDQKANNLLSSVALLTAALGILASSAIGATTQDVWQRLLKGAGVLLIVVYLLMAFYVIYTATKVYQARPNSVRPDTTAPGMLFPLMLVERYSVEGRVDEDAYLNRLQRLQPNEILHDYANQIIEVSDIYRAKQQLVNLALNNFSRLSILWVVTMLVLTLIIVWL
ncbi:MAG: hypothetical protein ABI670_08215 [Chloroflexota bacterium]